jgi:hypothetical protein
MERAEDLMATLDYEGSRGAAYLPFEHRLKMEPD